MSQFSLDYKSSKINYYVYGGGPNVLFCLHGYGENGSSFQFLENELGSLYTLYAIDLLFHGATEWAETRTFTAKDLLSVFSGIRSANSFSILAYSMGGRAAMHILQQFPEKIERMVLVAPDGLHVNFWYWLATQTFVGNKLFHVTMNDPKWFFAFLDGGGKVKLLNESIIKFVHHFLDNKEERILLYKRWSIMRKFKPRIATLRKVCSGKSIPLQLVFGRYDRIILSKRADGFKNEANIRIQLIDAGHQLLKPKYAHEIAALLSD